MSSPPLPSSSPAAPQGFGFVVHISDGVDSGRDVVRLHPDALTLLGIRPWDPVQLESEGGHRAGALVGFLDWNANRQLCVMDSVLAAGLGVSEAQHVVVTPVPARPAADVWLALPGGLNLPVDALRTALLGKAVIAGEAETLLPQDYNRAFTQEAAAGLNALRAALGPNFRTTEVRITRTDPDGCVLVAATTRLHIDGVPDDVVASRGPQAGLTLTDLGGLGTAPAQLREILELAYRHGALLERLGTDAPHGVLLQGPAGCGKGELVVALANELGVEVVRLSGLDLEYLEPDSVAKKLRESFGRLGTDPARPAVLLLQDIERIAPAERDAQGPALAVLLELLDRSAKTPTALVVATSNAPEQCAEALFAPGRLDRRIDIPMPDHAGRLEILRIHARPLPLAPDVSLDTVAAKTPAFVGADLARLCNQAALNAAARLKDAPTGADVTVTAADFAEALSLVHPSSLGSQRLDTGSVTFDDVGNSAVLKQALTEAVLWPLRYPDTFGRLGLEPPRGVLMYGPPGCGKTYVVRALANESAANLIAVKGAELLSKWVGESEAGVRELFRRARSAAPAIVFLDEIDALAPTRGSSTDAGVTDRVVAQLLTELDGVEPMQGVCVIGATNRPDLIDPALLRPGRLERHVFVDPPDESSRFEILQAICRKMPVAADVDLAAIAATTPGFSAADLQALAREAGFSALRRGPDAAQLGVDDFAAAQSKVRPSIDDAVVESLRTFRST